MGFRKAITTNIIIDAPVEHVWKILTDFASYPKWNPFVTRAEVTRGTLGTDAALRVIIKPDGAKAMTFRPSVINYDPPHHLRWRGRLLVPGLFDGVHEFRLSPQPDGGCLFTQQETFRGLTVPLFDTAATKRGFELMNSALKNRAE